MANFIDYYETLEISPNADSETIERMFRYLARRYHPDNRSTADRDRFDSVVEAHATLKDPVRRVEFDIEYRNHFGSRAEFVEQPSDNEGIERDVYIQNKLLSLFYLQRRRNINDPGIG